MSSCARGRTTRTVPHLTPNNRDNNFGIKTSLCLAHHAECAHVSGRARAVCVAIPSRTVPYRAKKQTPLTSSGPHKGRAPVAASASPCSLPPLIARRSFLTASCLAPTTPFAAPFSPPTAVDAATVTCEPTLIDGSTNRAALVAARPPLPRCRSPNVNVAASAAKAATPSSRAAPLPPPRSALSQGRAGAPSGLVHSHDCWTVVETIGAKARPGRQCASFILERNKSVSPSR